MDVTANQVGCPILRLVPDVTLHIFSLLKVAERQKVAQVCTNWRSIAYHPSLWRRVEPLVEKVILDSRPQFCEAGNRVVKKQKHPMLASLQRRCIKRVKVEDDKTLIHVTHNMAGLESLTISSAYSMGVNVRVLKRAFATKLHALSTLILTRCYKISINNVKLIVQNAVNLIHLDLSHCTRLNNRALSYLSKLTQLQVLMLGFCNWLSHEGIGHLTKANQSLKWLDVQGCQKLGEEALRLISVGLTGLKHLDLSRCHSVTDAGLMHLGAVANPQLTWLNIRYCSISSQGLQHLTTLGQLEELRVSNLMQIDNTCMQHVAQMNSLRFLDLGVMFINESSLLILASGGVKLTYLNVRLVDHITEDCCRSLSKLNQLQTLQLKMHIGMSDISDKGVSLFMIPDSNLVNLKLWGCDWVRDSTFAFLARMKRLRVLHVGCCRNFDCDSALLNLADGGSQLEDLELFNEIDNASEISNTTKMGRLEETRLSKVTRLARLRKIGFGRPLVVTESLKKELQNSGIEITYDIDYW